MLYTKSVGQHYGKFMNYLIDNGLNLDKVHLIGHSLGAHVSGFCGREIITGKAKRLTGSHTFICLYYYRSQAFLL